MMTEKVSMNITIQRHVTCSGDRSTALLVVMEQDEKEIYNGKRIFNVKGAYIVPAINLAVDNFKVQVDKMLDQVMSDAKDGGKRGNND